MKEIDVVIGEEIKCDVCGKVIYEREDSKLLQNSDYWHLMTCHNSWGNDSIDSVESFDLCSAECLREMFEEYCEESSRELNTMEFNVKHCQK